MSTHTVPQRNNQPIVPPAALILRDRAPDAGSPVEPTAEASHQDVHASQDAQASHHDAHPVRDAVLVGVKDAGSPLFRFLDTLGGHLILAVRACAAIFHRPFRLATYLDAASYIGYASLPIILLVGAFTGMVMSLQSVNAFHAFGITPYAAGLTGKALSLELGPVLTSLMLAGRAGAGIATEVGSMKITEQIEALVSMAVDPIQYLVSPRLLAGTIVAPILSLTFVVVGMTGAYFVAVVFQHVDQGQWFANLRDLLRIRDVLQGCIKAGVFGFMVTLVATYRGFHAEGGARGIGACATRAVVTAAAATLVLDYFLSDVLLTLMPPMRSTL
ncbi:MAG TPA: ABC transporter permease [Kofleriaceae bacterium]|nr:ABC transporter permease [Kofleriaceae bacterium]